MKTRVLSPMTASVYEICIHEGETCEESAVLLVLESMKVTHEILAPIGGTVLGVYVNEGEIVNQGDPLVDITAKTV